MSLRITFAEVCRTNRRKLRLSQDQLGAMVGVSRGHIANIEIGRANPPLDLVDRIARALDLEIDLAVRAPVILSSAPRDLVHAWCSGYGDRRLDSAGWLTAREVEIVHGRSHGWIDLLAFDRQSGTLLVIEIKTRLDDVGAIERQIAWYERAAPDVVRRLGWRPRRTVVWLLVLASDEVEAVLRADRDLFARAFPTRAKEMVHLLGEPTRPIVGRGLGLIDPTSHRRDWIIGSRIDGRRSPAPYRGYADAVGKLTA